MPNARALALTAAAVGLAACSTGSSDPPADVPAAVERSLDATSFRATIRENGNLVEEATYDRRRGMAVTLADGGEARQRGRTVYFRSTTTEGWITGTAPRPATIADFARDALRAAAQDGNGNGVRVSVTDGHVAAVEQTFDAGAITVRRRTTFDHYGDALVCASLLREQRVVRTVPADDGDDRRRMTACTPSS